MQNKHRSIKRTLAVFLSLLMLLSSWVFAAPSAAAADDGYGVVIAVPETLYMQPSASASITVASYVNNTVDASGNFSVDAQTTAATAGKFYIYSDAIQSVDTVAVDGAAVADFALTNSGSLFYDDSFTMTLNSGLTSAQTSTIEWAINCTMTDGSTATFYAYTVAYCPNRNVTADGLSGYNGAGDNSTYASSMVWLEGAQTSAEANAVNASDTPDNTHLFQNTSSSQVYLDPLGTGINVGSGRHADEYGSSSAQFNPGATKSILTCRCVRRDERTSDQSDTDQVVSHWDYNTTSAGVTVDTSRYTNLNQLPYLKLGYMVTDLDNSSSRWYVSDATSVAGNTFSMDGDNCSLKGHGFWRNFGKNLWNNNAGNVLLSSDGNQTRPEWGAGTDSSTGVKYNAAINTAVSGTGTDTRYYRGVVLAKASYYALTSTMVSLQVTKVDKSGWRNQINAVQSEGYQSLSADEFAKFKAGLKKIYEAVGTPTASSLDQVTVTFNNKNGTQLQSNAVDFYSDVTVPAAPTVAGQVFTGWSDGTETKTLGSTVKALTNVTYTAQYALDPSLVTMYAKEGNTGSPQYFNEINYTIYGLTTGTAFDSSGKSVMEVVAGENGRYKKTYQNAGSNPSYLNASTGTLLIDVSQHSTIDGVYVEYTPTMKAPQSLVKYGMQLYPVTNANPNPFGADTVNDPSETVNGKTYSLAYGSATGTVASYTEPNDYLTSERNVGTSDAWTPGTLTWYLTGPAPAIGESVQLRLVAISGARYEGSQNANSGNLQILTEWTDITITGYCGHTQATLVSAAPATLCNATGTVAYYHCPTCDKDFTDDTFATEVSDYSDHTYGATHDYSGTPTLTRPVKTGDTWGTGTYTYTCQRDASHPVFTESVARADYDKYDSVLAQINTLLAGDLTDDVKAALQDAKTAMEAIQQDYILPEQGLLDAAIQDILNTLNNNSSITVDEDGNITVGDDAYNKYTINFFDSNPTATIDTQSLKKGDTVNVPADPTKADRAIYTYSFNGWDPAVVTTVTGAADYTATYTTEHTSAASSALEIAQSVINNPGNYPDSFVTAVTNAKAGVEGCAVTADAATQTALLKALTDLTSTVDGNTLVDVDLTALTDAITEAKKITEDANAEQKYDTATLTDLSALIAAAEAYVAACPAQVTANDSAAKQAEILAKANELNDFEVGYILYAVTFTVDGAEYSKKADYHYGDAVVEPANPTRDARAIYSYEFAAWVENYAATVTANATYSATFTGTKTTAATQAILDADRILNDTENTYDADYIAALTAAKNAVETCDTEETAARQAELLAALTDPTNGLLGKAEGNVMTTVDTTELRTEYNKADAIVNHTENADKIYSAATLEALAAALATADPVLTQYEGVQIKTSDKTAAETAIAAQVAALKGVTITKIDYTITWNVDGTETTATYNYGDTPAYDGTPSRADRAIWKYQFTRWNPEIAAVTGEATYTAIFATDGKTTAAAQAIIDAQGIIDNASQYDATYIAKLTEAKDAVANCDPEASATVQQELLDALLTGDYGISKADNYSYAQITWNVAAGTVEQDVLYGTTPTFTGSTAKDDDTLYKYTFTGWNDGNHAFYAKDTALPTVSGPASYTAQYDKAYNDTVQGLLNEAEDILSEEHKDEYDGDYIDDLQELYDIFDDTAEPAADDQTKIDNIDDLSDLLGQKDNNKLVTVNTSLLEEAISDTRALLTDDKDKIYTPAGLTAIDNAIADAEAVVTQYKDKEIKASDKAAAEQAIQDAIDALNALNPEKINYTVTFNDEDGNQVSTKTDYNYGDTVAAPEAPAKAPRAIYSYSFDKWVENYSATVLDNATYTPTYTAANTSAATTAIGAAEEIIRNADQYDDGYITDLTAALNDVTGCDEDADATTQQNLLDALTREIGKADDNTLVQADTSALEAAITEAKKITEDPNADKIYAADTLAALTVAITEAEAVVTQYKGKEIKASDLPDAVSAIQAAAEALANVAINKIPYTITWSVDGAETTATYNYGDTPAFAGSTAKADDALYTYTFTGWDPEIATVTESTGYTAQYSNAYNKTVQDLLDDAKDILDDVDKYNDDYIEELQDLYDVFDDTKEPVATDEEKEAAIDDLRDKINEAQDNKLPADYTEYDALLTILDGLKDNDILTDSLRSQINDKLENQLPRDLKIDQQKTIDDEVKAIKALLDQILEKDGNGNYTNTIKDSAKIHYVVTFKWLDNKVNQRVVKGESAVAPNVPAMIGVDGKIDGHYLFRGWDQDYSNVTKDMYITAQFDVEAHTDADEDNYCEVCGCKIDTSFKCGMCKFYQKNKDIPVVGWFIIVIHFFVHMAAQISHWS